MRLVRKGAALAALSLAIFTTASAQTSWFWVGPNNGADPASGDFNTATNWLDADTGMLNSVPGLFDIAQHFAIVSGSSYTVSSSVSNEIGAVQVLTEAGGTSDNVVYDFNGNDLTLNGGEAQDLFGLFVGISAGAGSLTVLDGNYNQYVSLNVLADLDADPTASASLTIGAGATVTSDFLGLASGGAGGPADFIGGFGEGANLAGTLNVVDGGAYTGFQPQIGTDAGNVGIVNVDGASSTFMAFNQLAVTNQDPALSYAIAIGIDGSGEMNVTNGATVTTQFVGLSGGFADTTGTGVGTLNIDGGTFIHDAALNSTDAGFYVTFGDTGAAVMNVSNGGSYTSDFVTVLGGLGFSADVNVTSGGTLDSVNLLLGDGAGSTGTLVVDGGNVVSPIVLVGSEVGGVGVIEIKGGGSGTFDQWRLGELAGGSGSMTIDGAGTTVVDNFGSFVGYNGTGDLTVSGGASYVVNTSQGQGFFGVGRLAGSNGTVTVDGAGSVLNPQGAFANAMSIGRDAVGVMTVSNGGLATTSAGGDVAIGRTAAANGTVNVQTGGILRGHNGIAVGGSMTATGNIGLLNITNGGSIQTTHLRIWGGDTVNVNTGGFGTIGAIGTVVNTANTLTVRTGGTLSGLGTINGNVANVTGGTIAPGVSPGLLTINGNLNNGNCVVGAGGTVAMEIVSAGTAGTNYDSMVVSGDVLLGGTLNLIVSGTYVPNGANQFNVITGTNNIVGAFESITNRVITPGIGGRVWGDYKENNAGPNADRYYVAPRRQADFNGIGGVSGADYTIWADNFGKTWATFGEGDANGDRQVTGADYTVWADNFGQTSIGDGEDAVGTYGYGVDFEAVADAPVVDVDNDVALEILKGIDHRFAQGSIPGMGATAVPEPSSLILGGLALAGLAGLVYRRRSV